MNLLPIIYTSLMIFSGFTIFVITVSYISYKVRQRNSNHFETAPLNLGDNLAFADGTPIRQTNLTYMEKPQPVYEMPIIDEYEASVKRLEIERPVIRKKTQTISPIVEPKIQYIRERETYHQPKSYNNRNYTTAERTGGKRFNVLNNESSLPHRKVANSDLDFNILNYYSDDETVNFPPTYKDFN